MAKTKHEDITQFFSKKNMQFWNKNIDIYAYKWSAYQIKRQNSSSPKDAMQLWEIGCMSFDK